jgi:hydroxyacylglutathione hydrolase
VSGQPDPPDLEVFETRGLGDASYLLASSGEAVLVDPQRDAWRFLAVAARRGWRVLHVLETHVHNDYVSGAIETRAASGAEIVAPRAGGYGFPHRPAEDGTVVEIGGLRVVARATPGHTPEHLAWEVHVADTPDPWAVFTGGSLLVGSAGRTDLLGPQRTPELSAAQYATLQRLAALPAETRILPTHGAGSFCAAGPSDAARVTSVAAEVAGNPLLRLPDATAFERRLLQDAGRYPDYYREMAPVNRAGPPVLGGLPRPPALNPARLASQIARGTTVVDARDRASFAAGHLPGALNIELDASFGAYVGWLLDYDAPVALVLPQPTAEALEEATTQLVRIGWTRIAGYLDGGIDGWSSSGRAVDRYPIVSPAGLASELRAGQPTTVLDVRQPNEWRDEGGLEGATRIFVADLRSRFEALAPDAELTVVCKSGQRAAMGASILRAAGFRVRLVADGGVAEVSRALAPGG